MIVSAILVVLGLAAPGEHEDDMSTLVMRPRDRMRRVFESTSRRSVTAVRHG